MVYEVPFDEPPFDAVFFFERVRRGLEGIAMSYCDSGGWA